MHLPWLHVEGRALRAGGGALDGAVMSCWISQRNL